ncbi:MAG: hypothetical protein J3K34DRAFT_410318 [Monoraphidium minutum]|nr:MAG: hypothetical protein J3K34DRAFT_410318 [Monoraphidium minutum]
MQAGKREAANSGQKQFLVQSGGAPAGPRGEAAGAMRSRRGRQHTLDHARPAPQGTVTRQGGGARRETSRGMHAGRPGGPHLPARRLTPPCCPPRCARSEKQKSGNTNEWRQPARGPAHRRARGARGVAGGLQRGSTGRRQRRRGSYCPAAVARLVLAGAGRRRGAALSDRRRGARRLLAAGAARRGS